MQKLVPEPYRERDRVVTYVSREVSRLSVDTGVKLIRIRFDLAYEHKFRCVPVRRSSGPWANSLTIKLRRS